MIRYSNRRLTGDHFNYSAHTIDSGIAKTGFFDNNHVFDEAFITNQLSTYTENDNLLVDETLPFRKVLKKFSKQVFSTILSWKKTHQGSGKVAIWMSMLLTPTFAKLCQDPNLDYLFLEAYWPFRSKILLWFVFRFSYLIARYYGVENKLVISLGVNQNHQLFNLHTPNNWWNQISWANNIKTVEAQLLYIKKKCKGIAGVGYFISSIYGDFLSQIDSVMFKVFPD